MKWRLHPDRAVFRISQLISPFENAAFLSPHFDDDTKANLLNGSWPRTRSVRHRSRAGRIVQRRIRASTWVCKRVISSPLMRCRRDDPRAIYAALSFSLSLFLSCIAVIIPSNPRRQGNQGKTPLRAPGTPRYCLFYWSIRSASSDMVLRRFLSSADWRSRFRAERKKWFPRIYLEAKAGKRRISRGRNNPRFYPTTIYETDCDDGVSLYLGERERGEYIHVLWKTEPIGII